MKLKQSEIDDKYINVLTTRKVEAILHKQNLGEKITLAEKIWFNNEPGVPKAKLQFAMTKKELDEYTKCKLNVQYFAEKYCKIKREDGTIGPMTLRDYQKQIIDLYTKNNYSILMASRQTGKCNSLIDKVTIKDTYDKTYDKTYEITLGEMYYNLVKMERKLTFIENIKLFLYRILNII